MFSLDEDVLESLQADQRRKIRIMYAEYYRIDDASTSDMVRQWFLSDIKRFVRHSSTSAPPGHYIVLYEGQDNPIEERELDYFRLLRRPKTQASSQALLQLHNQIHQVLRMDYKHMSEEDEVDVLMLRGYKFNQPNVDSMGEDMVEHTDFVIIGGMTDYVDLNDWFAFSTTALKIANGKCGVAQGYCPLHRPFRFGGPEPGWQAQDGKYLVIHDFNKKHLKEHDIKYFEELRDRNLTCQGKVDFFCNVATAIIDEDFPGLLVDGEAPVHHLRCYTDNIGQGHYQHDVGDDDWEVVAIGPYQEPASVDWKKCIAKIQQKLPNEKFTVGCKEKYERDFFVE